MRNPMVLTSMALGSKGYYQRMLLDRAQRNQMRAMSMIFSILGLMFLTQALSSLVHYRSVETVANGMLILLWVTFAASVCLAAGFTIVQSIRGRWKQALFGWFTQSRQDTEGGSLRTDPVTALRFQKETVFFTVIYCVLISLPILFAVVFR